MLRICCCILIAASAFAGSLDDLKASFRNPPPDARIMMRWWWFGPSQTRDELDRELRVMRDADIGGVEIQPVYPLTVDGNYRYLSQEFLDNIGHAAQTARQLGLRVDITLGSGWPYGGPDTSVEHAAGRLRIERVPVQDGFAKKPSLEGGEEFIASFGMASKREMPVTSGPRVQADNDTSVWFFISSRTGQQVKRAAIGAEGFVLNHYDRAAIQEHLDKVAEPLLRAFGDHPPYAVFSDSLEVYGSDWTPQFLDEFRKRRGYDLRPHLLDLVDGSPAVRHDWGLTLTELAEENYLAPIRQWAHAHGTLFRSQNYGVPPVVLSSNSLVDLAEGEHGPNWRSFSQARWAASANHIYGRNITSAETWTWLHSPAFRATPLDMKAEADLHFLQGVNQIVGHGWPYSPPGEREPGWRFYAAGAFNDHNPWFVVMPDVALYLQRISFLMRQGQPANDVALYLPTDDAYARFKPGSVSVDEQMDELLGPEVIPQILDSGFNFDFIDERAIANVALPYKIIVLADVERMPIATLRKLQEFTKRGGVVIAVNRRPELAPGYFERNSSAVRELAAQMFPQIVADKQLGAALRSATTPDLETGAVEIGFVHRKLKAADLYFVANTSNHPVHAHINARSNFKKLQFWDALTGAATGGTEEFDLAPYESRVLVFSDEELPAETNAAASREDLTSGWTARAGDRHLNMPMLESWTELPQMRFYSGTVTYSRRFQASAEGHYVLDFGPGTPVSGEQHGPGMQAWLDGPVREAAVVFVNGKRAGSIWHPPYVLDISPYVHAGENDLSIAVSNTAINEMSGESLPDYRLLNMRYGERFTPQDMQNLTPLPSGILGHVTLLKR